MSDFLTDARSLHALHVMRDIQAAKLKQLDDDIKAKEAALLAAMTEAGVATVGDTAHVARIKQQRVYSAASWEEIYARILRTSEFDLLQRRLSSTAIRERENANDLPAGVRVVLLPKLEIERVK
jgi:hypothetical protein